MLRCASLNTVLSRLRQQCERAFSVPEILPIQSLKIVIVYNSY